MDGITLTSNIRWHTSAVSKKDRILLNGHRSCLLWFTGLSGSGKSTIASELENRLFQLSIRTYVLDGDNLRHGLNRNLGFSPADRRENIRRAGETARLFVDAGILTLATFISPYSEDRKMVRNMFEVDEFMEIFVSCPLAVCKERDPKGLFRKARTGLIRDFTGISAPYEEPGSPDLIISTDQIPVDEAVVQILNLLKKRNYIS